MKRAFVLAFLPLTLLALEPVNLVKDHSFEKDSEVWNFYTEAQGSADSSQANRHDPENSFSGLYSASCDTRTRPGFPMPGYDVWAVVIQGFCCRKTVSDLDSLICYYSILSREDDAGFNLVSFAYVDLCLNAEFVPVYSGYRLKRTSQVDPPRALKEIDLPRDTLWYVLEEAVGADMIAASISPNAPVDSVRLIVYGWQTTGLWRGMKVYLDDLRLTGYADYDVGVKEILSDTTGTPYIPVARIKNFGREPADSFLVIAEMFNDQDTFYADTLTWSLEADTEDTVTFAEWPPSLQSAMPGLILCTLCVHTVMEPDESDEDDAKLKQLILGGVAEQGKRDGLSLDVRTLTHPLRVSYSLPYTESGSLILYDATGRRIERVTVRGSGSVAFPSTISTGVYLVRLETSTLSVVRKAVVLK